MESITPLFTTIKSLPLLWPQQCPILFSSGAVAAHAATGTGRTALHQAALQGHLDTCMALVDSGADPAARDFSNQNPKMLASGNGHADVVAYFGEYLA